MDGFRMPRKKFMGLVIPRISDKLPPLKKLLAITILLLPSSAFAGFPSDCGHLNQKPCNFWEHVPSCVKGLVEDPFSSCVTPVTMTKKLIATTKKVVQLTQSTLHQCSTTAATTYNTVSQATVSEYNKVSQSIATGINNFGNNIVTKSQNAINDSRQSIQQLVTGMQSLSGASLDALRELVQQIPTGEINDQSRKDLLLIAHHLHVMASDSNRLFPTVTNSTFGVFVQAGATVAGVNLSRNVAFIMDTNPPSGAEPMAILYTVGGEISSPSEDGAGGQFGILWQPGPIENADGGQVGIGEEAGPASVGVSWSVSPGMEAQGPQGAIPGFSLAWANPCCSNPLKFSPSISGGYSSILREWQSSTVSASSNWANVYYVEPNGDLGYWKMNGNGTWAANGKIGNGWGGTRLVTAGSNGDIYAITSGNVLSFYKYDSNMNITVGGVHIGSGFGAITKMFSGGNDSNGDRILYGVTNTGTLILYKFSSGNNPYLKEQKEIGWGWGGFKFVFAGDNHVVYGVSAATGQLLRYAYDSGFNNTPSPNVVGTYWNQFSKVFGGPNGDIFAIAPNGTLFLYSDPGNNGFLNGPQQVGVGWALPQVTAMK